MRHCAIILFLTSAVKLLKASRVITKESPETTHGMEVAKQNASIFQVSKLSRFISNKCQKMLNFTIFTELFAKSDHTILPICDNYLITVDHQSPIGCNTFLPASRASNHDVTTI